MVRRSAGIAWICSIALGVLGAASAAAQQVDADTDGFFDQVDDCPYFANPDQRDTDADGRGDACECTDQNGDGRNTVADLVAINLAIFNPSVATPLCDGNNDGACNVADIIAGNIEIFSPGNTSVCARQPVPGPAAVPAFSFSIDIQGAAAYPGTTSLIPFTIRRAGGHGSPIAVDLATAAEGVSSHPLSLEAPFASGVLELDVSPDLAVSTLPLELRASDGVATYTQPLALSIRPPGPSARALILSALAAGSLDPATALLYRAYALYADPRLPPEYQGSGSEAHDATLQAEIEASIDTLPAGMRAQLEPFLLRPADVHSWYGERSPSGASRLLGAVSGLVRSCDEGPVLGSADELPIHCAETAGENLTRGWISRRSLNVPARIWAHCASPTDGEAGAAIERVKGLLERIWQPMVASMQEPPRDSSAAWVDLCSGVGDDALDFYLVDGSTLRIDRGDVIYQASGADGGTNSWPAAGRPAGDTHKSSFVLLPRAAVQQTGFHSTLIHEFFHVLQNSFNAGLREQLPGFGGLPDPPSANWWYTEASATWAEAHFDRTLFAGEREALREVYRPRFAQGFQKRGPLYPLNRLDGDGYQGFIWPYFMQQESAGSGTRPAREVWSAVESTQTLAAADRALDGVFAFDSHFREFAIRNLNQPINPGDALPRSRRHVSLDPAQFDSVDGEEPVSQVQPIPVDSDQPFQVDVAKLAAQYVLFTVSPSIRKLTFDFGPLGEQLAVDGFVKVLDEDWVAHDFTGEGKVTYCRDAPEENVELLLLVISNPHLDGSRQTGHIQVTGKQKSCARKWQGRVTYDQRYTQPPNTHILMTADLTWTASDQGPGIPGIVSFTPSGSVKVDHFSANGCVAQVVPSTAPVSPTDGALTITSLQTPATAFGSGGAGLVATLIDCQGRTEGFGFGMPFWPDEPLQLDPPGDRIDFAGALDTGGAPLEISLELHYTLDYVRD